MDQGLLSRYIHSTILYRVYITKISCPPAATEETRSLKFIEIAGTTKCYVTDNGHAVTIRVTWPTTDIHWNVEQVPANRIISMNTPKRGTSVYSPLSPIVSSSYTLLFFPFSWHWFPTSHSGTNLLYYKAAHHRTQRAYHWVPGECHVSPTGINKTRTYKLCSHKSLYMSWARALHENHALTPRRWQVWWLRWRDGKWCHVLEMNRGPEH